MAAFRGESKTSLATQLGQNSNQKNHICRGLYELQPKLLKGVMQGIIRDCYRWLLRAILGVKNHSLYDTTTLSMFVMGSWCMAQHHSNPAVMKGCQPRDYERRVHGP